MGKTGLRARAAGLLDLLRCRAGPDDDDATLVDYAAVCHIKRVPNPVLGEIFALSTPTSWDTLVLAHVAACWRKVAFAAPELWTDIDACGQQFEALRWCLERSGGCLVDVRLSLSQENWAAGVGPLLLAEVVSQAMRLRRLSILADFVGADKAVRVACGRLCAPHLEHLSFVFLEQLPWNQDFIQEFDFSPVVFAGGVPKLAVLRLQHAELPTFPPLRSVTALHLEEYTCPPMSFHCFCALLDELPALAKLSIYGDLVTSWSRTADIYLPHLRSLRSSSNARVGNMLLSLHAPALESLVLKNYRAVELTGLWAGLNCATELKFPALTSLSLHGSLSTSVLAAFVREFSGILHLELVNCYADDAVRLLEGKDALPELRSLMLHRLWDAAALGQLLVSRAHGLTVSLHCDAPLAYPGVQRWDKLAPWPSEADWDADDMFAQLRRSWDSPSL
ncbi:hypothetical protein B0H10DRAFT_2079509 [Mycena sp. CBHHK59/15]|nr:hypothetical protein B0H10DRAFT_2079509 [Mycena sp. CBHHK59/15]